MSLRNFSRLPSAFWWVAGIGCVIALARFSQAFLLLKAKDVGVTMSQVPNFLALLGLVYGMTAYPFGKLSDRVDRRIQLGAGVAVLGGCHLVMALADSSSVVVFGTILWGLHLGMIDGLMGASVADAAPSELRGSAFGAYYLGVGLASLLASALAGMLWMLGGAALTFFIGAGMAGMAFVAVLAGRSILPAYSKPMPN